MRRLAALIALASLASLAACEDEGVAIPAAAPPVTRRDAGTTGAASDDPKTTRREGVLRLGHLNVRRFFDATCESGSCDTGSFEAVVTESDFEARAEQLAFGLARLEADVVTLAEIESQASLDALQAKLKARGADYPVAYLGETGAPGSLDVAVLARGKLGEVKTYRKETPLAREDGSKTTFSRELPEVHLRLGSSDLIVFAAHFRSKADDDPGRRLAEAKAAREIIVAAGEANPGALVLLGGDLNDVPGSPPLDALEADGRLVRVAADLPPAAQGTYVFGGQDQAIDHIFTTAPHASAYVAKSATVVRDGKSGLAGSDHAAIYADFTFP